MQLRVLGCHGGETPAHRTSSFLLDGRVAIDAGAITSALSLGEQRKVEVILVSHSHLDHVRDLATLADNRCQAGGAPFTIAGTAGTIDALRKHFFNDCLWPDFAKIPTRAHPTFHYRVLAPEKTYDLAGHRVRAVLVHHTVESCGFLVYGRKGAIAYSGDTGPTERFWKVIGGVADLRALLMEVSFPNAEQPLATLSGHHTPASLAIELEKLPDHASLPILLYHIKPTFERAVHRDLRAIRGRNLHILRLEESFLL